MNLGTSKIVRLPKAIEEKWSRPRPEPIQSHTYRLQSGATFLFNHLQFALVPLTACPLGVLPF